MITYDGMPRYPVDYSKGVIYKIVCLDVRITETYVGSTTNLAARRYQHKITCGSRFKDCFLAPVYGFIRATGGWDNWEAVLIEEWPCSSADELWARERYHMKELGATLNSQWRTGRNAASAFVLRRIEELRAAGIVD